jgi:hypothetical protein
MVHHAKNWHGNTDKDAYLLRCYAIFSWKYICFEAAQCLHLQGHAGTASTYAQTLKNEALCSF